MDFTPVWNQLRTRAWMWTFGRGAVETGLQLSKQNRVRLRGVQVLSEREAEVTASVSDSTMTPYDTTATLKLNDAEQLSIMTRCLCPGGAYCKHAAALLAHASTAPIQQDIEARVAALARTVAPVVKEAPKPAANIQYHMGAKPYPVLMLKRVDATQANNAKQSKLLRVPVADPMVIAAPAPPSATSSLMTDLSTVRPVLIRAQRQRERQKLVGKGNPLKVAPKK